MSWVADCHMCAHGSPGSMCQPASVVLAQSKGPSDGLGNLLKYRNVTTRKFDYATVHEVPLEKM